MRSTCFGNPAFHLLLFSFFSLQNPLPGIQALPSPSNLLEWHYVLTGDEDSDYANGYYHGKIIFPSTYPFKPPSILMLTPSGRFDPGAKICLSMSDFHPETWNPIWSVSQILLGLQSFFYENTSTTGALRAVPAAEKRRLASISLAHNVKNPIFRKLFPELVEVATAKAKGEEDKVAAAALKAASSPSLSAAAAARVVPRVVVAPLPAPPPVVHDDGLPALPWGVLLAMAALATSVGLIYALIRMD